MKPGIIILAVLALSLAPLVSGHALERGPVEKSTEAYAIGFVTEPAFPVAGRETHFEIHVKDKNNGSLSDLQVDLELHGEQRSIKLAAKESGQGQYDAGYTFSRGGAYEVHLLINGEELPLEFEVVVDAFGLPGILQALVLAIFTLILLFLAYRGCRNKPTPR